MSETLTVKPSIKLNGQSNWLVWSKTIAQYLDYQECWEACMEPTTQVVTTNDSKTTDSSTTATTTIAVTNEQRKKDKKALVIIHSNITENILQSIVHCNTAYDAWMTLKNKYELKNGTARTHVMHTLTTMKMHDDQAIEDVATEFNNTVVQ